MTARIALVITGGTIDSIGTNRLDLVAYSEAGVRLGAGELLARIPEVDQFAQVQEISFRRIPSHALVNDDWLDLARLVQDLFDRQQADGVVVTHGTNTLEETAYFLHLVIKSDRPIVVVGSMRPASGLSTDADLNLLNAVRVASDPSSRGRGALVVMNDTIYSARDVTKTATLRVETFQARDLGPLGFADPDGRVVYYHRPERRHSLASELDVRNVVALPRADIVVSYVGSDASVVEALVSAGAQGLVSAGTGGGRPSPAEEAALDHAVATGVVIVQSSRTGSGRVVRTPSLRRRHMVVADNLPPWKARVLLSLALTRTRDPEEVQRLFDTH